MFKIPSISISFNRCVTPELAVRISSLILFSEGSRNIYMDHAYILDGN